MVKNIKIFFLTACILFSSYGVLTGKVFGPDFGKRMRFGIRMAEKNLFPAEMLLRFKDNIGLTAEQIGKIEKMQTAHQESMIKRKADIKVFELRLFSYLKNDKIDRSKMAKMIGNIANMKTDMHIDGINYLLDLRDILTSEQKVKLEEIKREMRHRMMEKRGRFGKGLKRNRW